MTLPCGNYKWRNDLTIDDILNAECPGGVGYFIEVDLEYPCLFHDHHSNLPLVPEKLQILSEWLSDYVKSFGTPASRVAKPVGNLFDEYFHVYHVRNLKFYTEKDLTVKRFQRVLQLNQSCCWGNFASENTALRKQAQTDFDKNFLSYFKTLSLGRQLRICKIVDKTVLVYSTGGKNLHTKTLFLNFQLIHELFAS